MFRFLKRKKAKPEVVAIELIDVTFGNFNHFTRMYAPEDAKWIRDEYGDGRIFVEHTEDGDIFYSEQSWLNGGI